MYPNGPISHERHHLVFWKKLRAELDSDEEEDDDEEDFSGNDDTSSTGNEKPSDDYNNLDNDDEDDYDDNNNDKFFLRTSSKNLPTAAEICANACYNQTKAQRVASTPKTSLMNLINKFNPKIVSTQRRQTDETVDLGDEDEDLSRQVCRHDSLVQRTPTSFTRRLSDCMQNLALETEQPRRRRSFTNAYAA